MKSFTLNPVPLALVGSLLSACGSEVLVETDRPAYAPGTCVGIIANNPRLNPMFVDHCAPPLERQTEEGWEVIPPLEDSFCLLWGMEVGAFGRGGFWAQLPAELIEGTYRFTVGMGWNSTNEQVRGPSQPFSVTGPAEEIYCAIDGPFDPDTLER